MSQQVATTSNWAWASVILLSLVYTASGAKKLLKPHPAFGPGANYPGWFQQTAGLFEVVSVGLFYFDRQAALLMSSVFLGGVYFTQTLPNGPLAKAGPKALIPVAICSSATLYLLFQDSRGVPSQALDGLKQSVLGADPNKLIYLGGLGFGFISGAVLRAMNAGTRPE